jgi:hypothetical protein
MARIDRHGRAPATESLPPTSDHLTDLGRSSPAESGRLAAMLSFQPIPSALNPRRAIVKCVAHWTAIQMQGARRLNRVYQNESCSIGRARSVASDMGSSVWSDPSVAASMVRINPTFCSSVPERASFSGEGSRNRPASPWIDANQGFKLAPRDSVIATCQTTDSDPADGPWLTKSPGRGQWL